MTLFGCPCVCVCKFFIINFVIFVIEVQNNGSVVLVNASNIYN